MDDPQAERKGASPPVLTGAFEYRRACALPLTGNPQASGLPEIRSACHAFCLIDDVIDFLIRSGRSHPQKSLGAQLIDYLLSRGRRFLRPDCFLGFGNS